MASWPRAVRPAVALAAALLAAATSGMDNGEALLPPMGWRSWNAFYADINSTVIEQMVDAVAAGRDPATGALHRGSNLSLLSLGWGEVHYANGTPAVDPGRFPNMPALVAYGHAKGVRMGFYLNGCGCTERVEKIINYEGDVRATVGWGFDGVKIDSCGAQKNMTRYGALFNKSGRAVTIENCHQGQNITDGGDPDQMGPGWCPYNLFRTSGDITNLWDRVMSNLMTVVPFLEPAAPGSHPLSRPGCWSYPDMLEVGRMPEHNTAESRSHFAAWCVASAPLTLGFDLTDERQFAVAWPVISNRLAIEVSQTWVRGAQHPSGRLHSRWQAANAPTLALRDSCSAEGGCVDKNVNCSRWARERQCELNPGYMNGNCAKSCGTCPKGRYTGFSYDLRTKTLRQGDLCFDTDGQLPPAVNTINVLRVLPCVPGKATQRWTVPEAGTPGDVQADDGSGCLGLQNTWLWDYVPVPALGACNGKGGWALQANGTVSHEHGGCLMVSTNSGPPSTVWSKPLTGSRHAVLVVNGADVDQHVSVDLAKLGLGGSARAWDGINVWTGVAVSNVTTLGATLPPHDCMFVVLTPRG